MESTFDRECFFLYVVPSYPTVFDLVIRPLPTKDKNVETSWLRGSMHEKSSVKNVKWF